QAFGLDRADLLSGEIDHGHHLAAEQVLRLVMLGDLCAGFAHADLGAEIHVQDIGRLARFWKRLCVDHGADAQLDLREISPFDLLHTEACQRFMASKNWALVLVCFMRSMSSSMAARSSMPCNSLRSTHMRCNSSGSTSFSSRRVPERLTWMAG